MCIRDRNLNQEIVLKFIVMEKLFPRSLKYCVDKLLEVQRFLPKSPKIRKDMSKLLIEFSCNNLYRNDKKMLKVLDDFQFGLIKLDKEINARFFN